MGVLWASTAHAHIELLEPSSRYDGSQNKSCPCGAGLSNRTCNVERDGSDPNRSDRVTELRAGSTITVRVDEYIGHSGRYRIAFDPVGADVEDFNQHILLDVPDPGDVSGLWEFEVTLPDVTCDRCTLQVVQAMHGDEEHSVPDPSIVSSYYTCADIRLVGGSVVVQDESSSGGEETTGAFEDSESTSTGLSDEGFGTTGEASSTSTSVAAAESSSTSGGCSVALHQEGPRSLGWSVALLGVAGVLRRRRLRAD